MDFVVEPLAERLRIVQKLESWEIGKSSKTISLVLSSLVVSVIYQLGAELTLPASLFKVLSILAPFLELVFPTFNLC